MINLTKHHLFRVPHSTPELYLMGQAHSKDGTAPRDAWDWQKPSTQETQSTTSQEDERRHHRSLQSDEHPLALGALRLNTDERQPRAQSQDSERQRSKSRKRSLRHESPHHKYSIPSSFFLSPITSTEERFPESSIDRKLGQSWENDPDAEYTQEYYQELRNHDLKRQDIKQDLHQVLMPQDANLHNYHQQDPPTPYDDNEPKSHTHDFEHVNHNDQSLGHVLELEGSPKNVLDSRDSYLDSPESQEEPFSPLLSLPLEILYTIIEIVYYDDNSISINANLESFASTIPLLSKKIHQLSLCFLYKYAIFNRPHSFDKFLENLLNNPTIGKYVEYMDFQQFTSIGLGRTGRMNQEIQMVTSTTIARALNLTPNLFEFMASENIQDDMDVNVLDILFNHLPKIQTLDFCGASSEAFVRAFQQLVIQGTQDIEMEDIEKLEEQQDFAMEDMNSPSPQPEAELSRIEPRESSLKHLMKVSFHDCSSLTPDIFIKLLPNFTALTRLDLNHTSITSTILLNHLPHSVRLTHLSLARCSKLTTKDLINFLTVHPAVANDSLQWLNLQIDSNVVSPLSDVYLLYTLRHLKASNLKYLNLGGLPIDNKILTVLKNKFTSLESLSLCHASVNVDELLSFLQDNDSVLKFLDLTGTKNLSRWNLTHLLKSTFNSSLIAIEFDYKVLFDLTSKGQNVKVTPVQQTFLDPVCAPQIWKFYDNEGRRAWIYKLEESDPEYSSIVNSTSNSGANSAAFSSNLVYYDLETGNKIVSKVKKPEFLKYASRKITCSIGYYNIKNAKKLVRKKGSKFEEDVWPSEFSQRGIYNYYSLNVK